MEPNDNNPLKPQPTGNLKLMTIFVAVLALHVLVISGFALKSWLYPSNPDNDLALDKTHKSRIAGDSTIGDVTAADSGSSDKSPAPSTATADNSGTTETTTPADDASTSSPTSTPAAAAAASTAATSTAATPTASATDTAANASTPTANSVITVPASPAMPATPTVVEDASAAAANPEVTASTPSGPVRHGPVVNPPDLLTPPAEPAASTAPAAPTVADDSSATASVDGVPYTVKRGDSLARIAHRHHVALAKLRAANSLASNAPLHIGQKLVIPSRTSKTAVDTSETLAAAPSTTSASSTPSSVATAPVAQPVQESDGVALPTRKSTLASALPRHTHKTTGSTRHLYTVVKGDTLTKIARRYHTSTSALMAANSLPNAGRLSIGQKLHIPSHSSGEASTAQQTATPESEPHSTAKGQLANYVP